MTAVARPSSSWTRIVIRFGTISAIRRESSCCGAREAEHGVKGDEELKADEAERHGVQRNVDTCAVTTAPITAGLNTNDGNGVTQSHHGDRSETTESQLERNVHIDLEPEEVDVGRRRDERDAEEPAKRPRRLRFVSL